jgi:copper chaperone CopZ
MSRAKMQTPRLKATRTTVAAILAVAWMGVALVAACSRAEEPPAKVEHVVLHVEGMTCAFCAVAIRTALGRRSGVQSVKVDVAEQRVVVAYDPAQVLPQQLVEAVTNLGYVARLATPEGQ